MSLDDPQTPRDLSPDHKISVLLVDDHAVVRQGLRMFIEMQADMQVIGEGANGREALELADRLNPDVILLDLMMPLVDGVEATRRIMEHNPRSRVLILTSFGEDDRVFPAIRAGAQDTCSKISSRGTWCRPSGKPARARRNCTRRLPGA